MVDPVESTITLAKGFFTSWIFSIATTNYPHFKQSIHMAQNTVVHQFLSHQKTMCTTSSFSMRVTSRIWLFANSQRRTAARRTQLLLQIFFTTLPLCQFRRIHRRSQCYHPNSTWWWTRLRWWQLRVLRKQPEEWMALKVFLQSFIMHIKEKKNNREITWSLLWTTPWWSSGLNAIRPSISKFSIPPTTTALPTKTFQHIPC